MKRECQRRGAVELISSTGEQFWLPTICKTWKCVECQKKLLMLIQARIQYGMECFDRSLFITVTYVMRDQSSLRSAESVAEDLKKLWKRLKKKKRYAEVSYVKVPELTKRGQVHVHMIVGNVSGTATCRRGKKEPLKDWKGRDCTEIGTCVQHEVSRVWEEITGGSFVVDVSLVRSGPRTAAYVTGYIRKDFVGHSALEARGFKRRYAFSRNWPSMGRMQLRGTVDQTWKRVTMMPLHYLRAAYPEINKHIVEGGDIDIMERVGEDVVAHVFGDPEVNAVKRALKKVKEIE